MATIKTPAAGVSPYQEAAAAPVVLRADANGNTVLANPTVTATAAATAAAATNANSNVIVNGNEALNSLIATSRSGVFEGANVTINLEEQLFNTTNQVTSTTNYPSGGIGEIQYNSGSNSFASSAYFTYTSGNVVTPGIRTDGYFYSNGAPFVSGGNAAIGNFVFTGDTMTTSNPTLYITANGDSNSSVTSIKNVSNAGNSDIILNRAQVAITSGTSNTWTFGATGTTQFPGNLLHPPAGNPLDIQVTVGNAYSTVSLYETGSQLIIQDNTTGPNPAWALFEADLGNVNTPQAVVILKPGDTGTEVRWTFNATGDVVFPTLSTQRGDNPSGTITGQTLLFGDNTQEAVISTPDGNVDYINSQRLVINPGAGAANTSGEGGDIYLWAGRGGNASGSGGDIKIRGGQGGTGNGYGGYIRMEAGDGDSSGGYPGYIELLGGTGGTGQPGGYIHILGGQGPIAGGDANITGGTGSGIGLGGNVNLVGGISANGLADYGRVNISSGASTWVFDNAGNLTLPANTFAVNYANGNPVVISGGAAGLPLANGTSNINIATANGNVTITANGSPTWNFDYNGILTLPGNSRVAPVGANIELQAAAGGYAEIVTSDGNSYVAVTNGGAEIVTSGVYTWAFNNVGTLTTPGSSGNITGANVIIANILSAIGDVESSNVNAATLSAIGNVVANNAIITQVISGATLELVSTANVGNLSTVGSVSAGGNITSRTAIYTGNGAAWQTQVALANVVFVGAEVADTYIQAAMIETSGNGSADWVSYANNGNTDSGWIDMGITGNTFNDPDYELTDPNDGYILVQGFGGGSPLGGNLILATGDTGLAHDIVFATGGFTHANIKARLIDATGEFSVVGNIAGNYFIGNGSQLTDVGAATVPSQNILPTIQTITVADTSGVGNAGGAGDAFANVTVSNVIPVTEYGVIVTSGTSSQKYATGALGSIPGTVQLTFTTGLNSTPFTVYAYVTSNAGTYYSNSATGTSGICLLAGTQIALSDGTRKAIEDITYTDKLLSWDFDRGCYAETTALWIKRSETGSQYNLLTFSDGTTLRTFDQHRIFNKQAGAFTYPMTEATPVGTITVNEHGQEITLTNKQVIQDTIEYYNVITDYHMNLFSDSVLTSCRFNNIYPITDMKFVKDSRKLRTRAEFENVEDRFFHGLRLAEQTADLETVEWYVNRLLATEVSTQLELAF